MIPADELRAAAQRLRELARAAIDRQIHGDNGQVMRFVAIEPATAAHIATLLEVQAQLGITGVALDVARSINEVPR